MEKLIKKVHELTYKATPYDVDGRHKIMKELEGMRLHYDNEIARLQKNDAVKKYIENKSKSDYLRDVYRRLIGYGYLPK